VLRGFRVILLLLAASSIASGSPALYLPALETLEAGWSRHFLHSAINHFNAGEFIYSLEELDNALHHAPNPGTAAFIHIYKGRAFYGLKNEAKAREEFEAAFRTAPESGLRMQPAASLHFRPAGLPMRSSFCSAE
jgi:Tfp pilus assembly protein PilF